MLTRWEEYVNKSKNNHNNFPAYESIAYKNNFLNRPIVNEYLEMLWKLLKYLGCEQHRKEKKFKLVLTHDIDNILKYPYLKSGLKNIYRHIISRNWKIATKEIRQKTMTHLKMQPDPYDTFDYLMDISERLNTKSYFFFIATGKTKFDKWYDINSKCVRNIVNKIKIRQHNIGIHSSYNSFNDYKQFYKEKYELENLFNLSIGFGRGHYLRFEIPTTWQIWNDCHMEWDSTLGYAEKEGFRCGTCFEFKTFNILTRQPLFLKEKPLIVMEASLVNYQNLNPKEMEKNIFKILNKVKTYKGEFVFLWHNSSFNTDKWEKYQHIYEKVLLSNYKR
jgi:hypothetical protein